MSLENENQSMVIKNNKLYSFDDLKLYKYSLPDLKLEKSVEMGTRNKYDFYAATVLL